MSGRLAVARHRAGTLAELAQASVLVVRLANDAEGKPREALVVRDGSGQLRAYRNLCRHLPVPLGVSYPGAPPLLRAGHLTCLTHGAQYRVLDGLCVSGPCRGSSLYALPVEVEADAVFVLDDAW